MKSLGTFFLLHVFFVRRDGICVYLCNILFTNEFHIPINFSVTMFGGAN